MKKLFPIHFVSKLHARMRRTSGFTLIETMVAVTIVALSVTGPLVGASRAVVAGEIASDKLTASYLSQEGLEYVRWMRDDAFLALYPPDSGTAATAWDHFLNGTAAFSIAACRTSACTLDPANSMATALATCSGTCTAPLYLANGIYTQKSNIVGSVKTAFTRTVQVFPLSSTEVRVVSTVSWKFHGSPYSVTSTDHLTPWQ